MLAASRSCPAALRSSRLNWIYASSRPAGLIEMQSALVDSSAHGSAVQRVPSTADSTVPPVVILTSVLTETQRPTWVMTETVAGHTLTTTVLQETVQPDSVQAQTPQGKTTHLATVTLSSSPPADFRPVTTTTSTPINAPTPAIDDFPVSSRSESSAIVAHTRTRLAGAQPPLASTPTTSSSPHTWSTAPSTRSIAPSAQSTVPSTRSSAPSSRSIALSTTSKSSDQQIVQQETTASISSPTPSSSPSTTSSPTAGGFAALADKFSAQANNISDAEVGKIVGSAIGSVTFVILGLVAIFLVCRRRRRIQHEKHLSQQRLLRDSGSTMSSNGLHQSRNSMPIEQAAPMPPVSVLPQPRELASTQSRPEPAQAAPTRDPWTGPMYLRNENRHTEGHPTDLEKSPGSPVSPALYISPPSHSASNVSRTSFEAGMKFVEHYDASTRNSLYENTYLPGQAISTLPGEAISPLPNDSRRVSHFHDTPQTHDGRRSNPFDLEPPPKASRKWSYFPSMPGPRAANF